MTQVNELNRQYEQALAFYANSNNYNCDVELDHDEGVARLANAGPIHDDRGKLARSALQKGETKQHDELGKQYRRTLMFYANAGLYNYGVCIDYEEDYAYFTSHGGMFDDFGKMARSVLVGE